MDAADLRPLGIGEILDVAIKLYRDKFGSLVKAVAVVVAPLYALIAVIQLSIGVDGERSENPGAFDASTSTGDIDPEELLAVLVGFFIVFVLVFMVTQVATATGLRIVGTAYLGDDVSWRQSLRYALSRFWALLWASVLLFLVAGAAVTPWVVAAVVVTPFFALGAFVTAVYLFGAFAVTVPTILLEDVRGMAALRRSWQLVRGRWWPVVVVIVLGTMLAWIVSGFISGILNIAFIVAGGVVAEVIGNAITSTISASLVTPFTAAITAVVYFDLRVRKEGLDLELLARTVGSPDGHDLPGGPPLSPDG